jgi:hypothetical protein
METDLNRLCWGKEDDHISQISSKSFKGSYVCTRRISLGQSDPASPNRHHKVIFSNSDDVQYHYGYTNMRFYGDHQQIESIALSLGGQTFDKIYPKIMNRLETFSILTEHILPALYIHQFAVIVEHSGNLDIIFDVVQITNPLTDEESAEFVYKGIQFNGAEPLRKGRTKIRLCFNHPTIKLLALSDQPVSNIIMTIYTIDRQLYEFKFDTIDEKTHQCIFGKSVNLSRTDHIVIDCQNENQTNLYVFAESLHVAKINRDLIGMVFSH